MFFVSDSCYLRIGCRSCSTVETLPPFPVDHPPTPPQTCAPQTGPACQSPLLFHSGAHETTPAASPRREGHSQGIPSDIVTQQIMAWRNPLRVARGKSTLFSKGLRWSPTFTLSTQLQRPTLTLCETIFIHVGGGSNLVENACLSSVDTQVSEPICWDTCLPCMVLCCFLHSVKLT